MMMMMMMMIMTPVRVKLPVFGSFEKVDLIILGPNHRCVHICRDPTEALVQRLGVATVQLAKG